MAPLSLIILALSFQLTLGHQNYYYTRTRSDPNHLRVSEEFKNNYVDEKKIYSRINGSTYEYYKSDMTMSHDELVFETIDKIFRHRLSPFYHHHYDSDEDKKRSFDSARVSHEACARDLLYLVDKLPKRTNSRNPFLNFDDDHQSPEVTAFFDSYGRQEAGLLMGNTYWVGAYDQCVNRHIFELTGESPGKKMSLEQNEQQKSFKQDNTQATEYSDNNDDNKQVVSFKGRYCVSALKSRTWDSIISAKKTRFRDYFKSERQFENYAKLFRLQVGICLPDSCDSSSLERHSDEIKLLTTSMLEQRYADYELIDLYCLPDETSPLRAWTGSALYFVVFILVWLLIIFLATTADLFEFVDTMDASAVADKQDTKRGGERKSRRLQLLVGWFSLRANYRKLMRVASPDEEGERARSADTRQAAEERASAAARVPADAAGQPQQREQKTQAQDGDNELKVNLRFLNAFKVMIMFWIVNGHIMLLMIQTAKNILYSDALLNGLMHFLIGATFGVDLFFTMTGFITSYLIFSSGHAYKMKPATWLYLSFHRYWRLAPMYLITFWFSRAVVQLLGSGPLWDYGTSNLTFRGLCNHESWWYPLTLTSNLHGLFDECMITSWYISCDMQFWLISPIFIHLLAKHPLHGWMASLATILMSSKFRYDAILAGQSARHDELVQPRADIFMRVSHDLPALYTHPHYRISAYIVGLLAGHYVYATKVGAIGVKRRGIMAYTGLFLFVVMSFVSYLLANYYPHSLLRYAKTVAALAYSMDHLIMSVGASLILIAMCFGQWPKIVKFLSHPNWTRLSKLNYALLLLQCEAIYYQIFRYDQVPVAGTRELINILFNLLVTLYPLAFVVTIALEFPLANIEKLLR